MRTICNSKVILLGGIMVMLASACFMACHREKSAMGNDQTGKTVFRKTRGECSRAQFHGNRRKQRYNFDLEGWRKRARTIYGIFVGPGEKHKRPDEGSGNFRFGQGMEHRELHFPAGLAGGARCASKSGVDGSEGDFRRGRHESHKGNCRERTKPQGEFCGSVRAVRGIKVVSDTNGILNGKMNMLNKRFRAKTGNRHMNFADGANH